MRINTRTDTIELIAEERKTLAKANKLLQLFGKYGTDSMQEQAAKAVVALNQIELELDANANEALEV
jgi:uncharacterized phage infection (PIP) family protein YhgE